MKRFHLSGRVTLRLLVCVVAIAVTQDGLWAWGTSRRVPYFGYYFIHNDDSNSGGGSYNYIDEVAGYSNIAWIRPDNEALTTAIGHQLENADIRVIVQFHITCERFVNNMGQLESYLDNMAKEIIDADMWNLVVAASPGEEWYGHETDPGWELYNCPIFDGITDKAARRNRLRDKLNDVIAVIENRWDVPTVLVEHHWNDDFDLFGLDGYSPVPSNVDVLGLDPYMGGNGWTSDCGSGMQEKFYYEVRQFYDLALANYPQPILMVGQSFTTSDPPVPMPSTCQMDWWYALAQSSERFVALTWFAYADEVGGVQNHQNKRAWLQQMYLHNETIP